MAYTNGLFVYDLILLILLSINGRNFKNAYRRTRAVNAHLLWPPRLESIVCCVVWLGDINNDICLF
jgi:hypothetical protein